MKRTTLPTAQEVATAAAKDAIATLSKAIIENGKASWVLAGGSSPMAAYKIIASEYAESIDWSKVTIVIGDERCVPLDHEDSNWGQISKILFANKLIAASHQLVPRAELEAVEGAADYSHQLRQHLTNESGELQIDLLWLGVGEDGHTLSLFPSHPGLEDTSDIVIPIFNSPKPPSERITFSLNSATRAKKVIIFATGASKMEALMQVERNANSLPIGMVAEKANSAGAEVTWLFDEAARG